MKNCLLILLSCLISLPSVFSQFVDDIRIADIKEEYIQIYKWGSAGRKIFVNLDYGQLKLPGDSGNQRIKDEDGNPVQFNSIIHAINYLKKLNYDLFEVYSFGSGDTVSPYYILRKKPPLSLLDD